MSCLLWDCRAVVFGGCNSHLVFCELDSLTIPYCLPCNQGMGSGHNACHLYTVCVVYVCIHRLMMEERCLILPS